MPVIDHSLPGAELVEEGIADLADGRESVNALLVTIGRTRLADAGLDVPVGPPDAEIRLYLMLRDQHGDDAHGQYNALVRRLVSFEHALECAR